MRIRIKIKYRGKQKIENRKQKTGRISNRLRKNILLKISLSGISSPESSPDISRKSSFEWENIPAKDNKRRTLHWKIRTEYEMKENQ